MAADARVAVQFRPPSTDRYAHMAIYPYPMHLVSNWQLGDGTNIVIRPIRPEDAEIEQAFVRDLSEESRYFRFMNSIQELSQAMLVRFTQIDYNREIALIAVTQTHDDKTEPKEIEVGVARYATNPDGESCEFAIVIADHMHGKGLGNKLMTTLMDAGREKGLKIMQGEVLSQNNHMLKLMKNLDFTIEANLEDDSIKTIYKLL